MTNKNGKVTVSREVAEAIGQDRKLFDDPSGLVEAHVNNPNGYYAGSYKAPLNGLPLDTLIRALYIGYEIQLTPEEELVEYIRKLENEMDNTDSVDVKQTYEYEIYGAEKAAEILGVKLPEGADAN